MWCPKMSSEKNTILIRNGTVVNHDFMEKADVLVKDGLIQMVKQNLSLPTEQDVRVIDATNRLVIPGGIDPHTHLQQPFMGTVTADSYLSGTAAALAGGTTTIIDFVTTGKGKSLIGDFLKWKSWADPDACCDFALSVVAPDWDDRVAKEMETLVKEHGVNSFKFFMAFKGRFMLTDRELYQAFKHCKDLGALARVHAENGDVIAEKEQELLNLGIRGPEGQLQARPEEVEAEATHRACMIANQTNTPLCVVHVNSSSAAVAIGRARECGVKVFGEAIAAALGTDGTHLMHECWAHAAGYVCAPPLRPDPNNAEKLMDLLSCGELQITGSDNCTFNTNQRALGKDDFTKIPNGINGLEDRMSVVWEKGVHTGKMSPMRFVEVTSSTTAKMFNMYPQKGRIAPGSQADIVIWNPTASRTISSKTHHQAVNFNIFEGLNCHGVAEITIFKGKIVWEDGNLNGVPGMGKYLSLKPFSPFVYGHVENQEKRRTPFKIQRDPYEGSVVEIDPNA